MNRFLVARLLGMLAALALALTLLGAAQAAPRAVVLPPSATPYGHTYSQWAASWWQWVLAQPTATNPNLDATGEYCAEGQRGPVWFLAGSFGSAPVSRTCTVPVGTALLVPVLNNAYFAFATDPPEQRTEEYIRAQAKGPLDPETAVTLEAAIDGNAVPGLVRYFEESSLFTVVLGPDNVFGLPEGFVLDPSADAGYYLVVAPLPSGEHTLRFGGTMNTGFSVDVTYHLSVVTG